MGENQAFNDIFRPGWFELYVGCMSSRKSMRLLERIDQVDRCTKLKWKVFMPEINTRDNVLKSRFGGMTFPCIKIPENRPEQIFDYLDGDEKFIGFDEIGMFNKKLVEIIDYLKKQGINIVGVGLNQYYNGEPFGIIPELMNISEKINILHAQCAVEGCFNAATRTQRHKRKNPDSSIFLPDDFNSPKIIIEGASKERNSMGQEVDMYKYSAVCIFHHDVPNRPQINKVGVMIGERN